jgi:2-dehydro-3-deoxygalactonokinase
MRNERMNWRNGYLAVDWGTTNRRVYAVDGAGRLESVEADGRGILSMEPGGFAEDVAEMRARHGGRPVLLAGMVGSNRGWIEAPYVPCPAGAADLAAAICWAEPGEVGIVPGVCLDEGPRTDVMRGEEVQVLGAVASGLAPPDSLICHPGTHAKWIAMEDGRIASFQTMMTGEIFSLLRRHSILFDQLQEPVGADASFHEGAAAGLAGAELLSSLFAIRARRALGRAHGHGASFASGLLIGSDVRLGLRLHGSGPIALIGRSDLCTLYGVALADAGHEAAQADGADAFLAGIHMLTEML